jgi:hypothetical protein
LKAKENETQTTTQNRMKHAPITCKLVHGKDSYSPGIMVFGVKLSTLVACNCGKWEPPTEAHIEETGMKISILKAQQRGHTNQS